MYFIPCALKAFSFQDHTHTHVLVWLKLSGAALQFKSISFCLVRAFCADNSHDCSGIYVCGPHMHTTHRAVIKGVKNVLVCATHSQLCHMSGELFKCRRPNSKSPTLRIDLLPCYPTLSGQGLDHLIFYFIDFSLREEAKGKLHFRRPCFKF